MSTTEDYSWEEVFAYAVNPLKGTKKEYLGTKNPRRCRFCKRSSPLATFRSQSHVIPAAFGNNTLFSFDECDDCNKTLGAKLEDDLSKLLSVPRAISMLPGRSKSSKIRKSGKASFVEQQRASNKLHIFQPRDDEGVNVVDCGNGLMRLMCDVPTHRPANVARSLGRMFLFKADELNPTFGPVLAWVTGAVDWFPLPLQVLTLPGNGRDIACFMAHRSLKSNRTILRFSFMYSQYLTATAVAIDDGPPLSKDISLFEYPEPYGEMLLANTSRLLVVDNQPVKGHVATVELTYRDKSVAEKPPTTRT